MAIEAMNPLPGDQEHQTLSRLLDDLQSASAFRLLRFPSSLENDFRQKRIQDSQHIIRSGRGYLVLTMLALFLKNLVMHPDVLSGHHFRLVWLTLLPLTVAVAGIVSGHRIKGIRDRLYPAMLVLGALAVFAITMSAALVPQPELSGMTAVYVTVTIALVTFGLRLLLYHYLPMMMVSGLLAVLTAGALGSPVQLLPFLHYYVLFTGVMAGLAAIAEWRERKAFLQGLLLDVQTRRLQSVNARLEKLARHDALTGLPNRRVFDDELEREWERGRREHKPLSLLFLDVDYFKRYNDALGHAAGDDCLQRIAGALRASLLRPSDLAARYGGEEFVMLLPGTDGHGAEAVARRVAQQLRLLDIAHPASAVSGRVTVSVGIATAVPGAGVTPAHLLRQADSALYEAKAGGRNGHVRFRRPVDDSLVPVAG